MSDSLTQYYEKAFETAGAGGSIYAPMAVLERAGHDRKLELLHELDLPPLAGKTVVDYGVGSWGFGCVFPRLKGCSRAIGVDISQFAVDCSRKISEADPALSGAQLTFITSSGYDIKLENQSADIVFAGECIEHIEDTHGFLAEVWRILKPGGLAIFTTPNASPYLYRQLELRWAMGFEHVALMDAPSLLEHLRFFFEIQSLAGYTSTVSPELDAMITDEAFAKEVAAMCRDKFELASGLVVSARKAPSDSGAEKIPKSQHKIAEAAEVIATPDFRDLSLYEGALGRMAVGDDAQLSVAIPSGATRAQLILWSHPWSGIAAISTRTHQQTVDLYSHVSGCTRVSLDREQLAGSQHLIVKPTGSKRAQSRGNEVILFRVVFSIDSR